MNKGQIQVTPLGRFDDRGAAELRLIPAPKTENPMRKKHAETSTMRLIKRLDCKEWRMRYRAAETLGKMRKQDAVDALCECLRKDRVSDVRACAAWALGRIRSVASFEALKAAAQNDPNSRVRQTADLAADMVYE